MHLAHVFIGRFDLAVPLSTVLIAAMAVVAASFGLIYLLPPRPSRPERSGAVVPRPVVIGLQTVAVLIVLYLAAVGIAGNQVTVLNGAVILFWVLLIPLLPLAHCLLGGAYEVANPFALGARLVTSGASARRERDPRLDRLGYWPAVVMLFLLVWFELALRVVPSSPRALGILVVVYSLFQVAMGAWLGEEWYRGGDLFAAITALASTVAAVAVTRDNDGFVRLKLGFRPARFLPAARGREALITLWLAGVLADGVKATPIWRAVSTASQDFSASIGQVGSIDLGALLLDTTEIVVTWLAFAAFFWAFAYLAARLVRRPLGEIARIVAPSLIPIALAYLLAHNLTQILAIGPLLFSASGADVGTAAFQLQQNASHLNPPLIFLVQVSAIVLGHVIAVVMAHARLRHSKAGEELAIRADLGWLSAMLIYTATSLWVLAQPITNQG
ncbi:MAG TPA: hypothetical protein VNV65_03235 [Candidatus Solibacter sp.]|jgi:hypothetical protein|nr:hypothetical protein [Candidatus Solibacter sp.]